MFTSTKVESAAEKQWQRSLYVYLQHVLVRCLIFQEWERRSHELRQLFNSGNGVPLETAHVSVIFMIVSTFFTVAIL